jgi:uncharacterized OB-fold protein
VPTPAPQPEIDADSRGFWEALKKKELRLCHCQSTSCGKWMQPPQERCRYCGEAAAMDRVSGKATLFSYIIVNKAVVAGFADKLPYAIGLVEFPEQTGLRINARLVGVDLRAVKIGMPLVADFEPHPGGDLLGLVFRPA